MSMWLRRGLIGVAVVALIGLGSLLTYITGGTKKAESSRTAAGGATTGLGWSQSHAYILNMMDTSEPPDGGMHAYNSTHGGTLDIPCPWNDEDDVMIFGKGNITAGDTEDVTMCMVADLYNNPFDYPKFVYVRAYSSKPNLEVTVTSHNVLPDGRVVDANFASHAPFTQRSSGGGRNLEYTLCAPDVVATTAKINYWQGLTFWGEIPGTGGYGQIVDYTLHIKNVGANTARDVAAFFSIAWDDYDGDGPFVTPTIQRLNGSEPRIDCPPRPIG